MERKGFSMECIRVTEDTMKWFLPLLTPEIQERLTNDPNTYAIGAVCDLTACGIVVVGVSELTDLPEEENGGSESDDDEFDEKYDEDEIDDAILEEETEGELMEILYLAVSDIYRRQGVATELINTVTECAHNPLSVVFSYFSAKDEDDEMYRFFDSLVDFSVEERDEYECRIDHDVLIGSEQMARYREKARGCRQFFSISPIIQKDFRQRIGDDAAYVFGTSDWVEPLCLCVCKNDTVVSAIFVSRYGENDLYLNYAYCAPGNETALIGLLAQAVGQIGELDTSPDLYVAPLVASARSITETLFPERVITQHFYLTTWDMDY